MRKLLLFALAIVLCSTGLSAISPSELTPAERDAYSKLSGDDARHYLATRGYLKLCVGVLAAPATAKSLPDLPEDYDGRFVTKAEQKQVDDAMDLSFAALLKGTVKEGDKKAAPATAPSLSPEQIAEAMGPSFASHLTAAEAAAYSKLSGEDAKRYLATRGYLKLCTMVLAAPATAGSLPDLPKGYDGRYVTVAEQRQVDDAMDLSFAALLSGTQKTAP